MPQTFGAGLKQIIVEPAGVPGAADSCYSELITINVASTVGTVTGRTVITDIGELLFMPQTASISVSLQTASGTWTSLGLPSTTQAAQFFSDGANLAFENTDTTTTVAATYYIIQ